MREWRVNQQLELHYIYYIAGLPDLTTKLKWRNFGGRRQYEEIVFGPEEPNDVADRVRGTMLTSAETIHRAGGIPVFATIATCSLEAWNRIRLEQQKTTHLNHFKEYDTMQLHLHQAAIYANRHIHEINNSNLVRTPRLGETVLKSRKGKYRCRYGRLGEDGVHLDSKTTEAWVKILRNVIKDHDSYIYVNV